MNINYKESLNEKPDKYLLEMILIKQEQYEPAALKIAEEILIERKVNIKEYEDNFEFIGNGIRDQSKERIEENNRSQLTIGFLCIAGGLGLNLLSLFAFGVKVGFIGMTIILYGLFVVVKYYIQRR